MDRLVYRKSHDTLCVNDEDLLDLLSTDSPVGIGGCRNDGNPLEPCELNVTVFDGASSSPNQVLRGGGQALMISRGSLDGPTDSNTLVNYIGMRVVQDGSWELHTMLSNLNQKSRTVFRDYARNCLISSLFCTTKANDGVGSDAFAPCWEKSALIYLANAILAANYQRPSPSHFLEKLRSLASNNVTDKASLVSDCLGVERATPSLLTRMCKSTVGFSETIGRGQDGLVEAKCDHMIRHSMLADCYAYLACVNHANFVSVKDLARSNPDLIHVLRVAFDLENDPEGLRRNLGSIRDACNGILASMGYANATRLH